MNFFLENIFTQQPSYYGDLNETIPAIVQVGDPAKFLKKVFFWPKVPEIYLRVCVCVYILGV